jgi:hypothetical protein
VVLLKPSRSKVRVRVTAPARVEGASDRGLARVENVCQLRDAEEVLVPELRRRLDPAERETLGQRLLERVGQLEGRPRRGW